MPLILTILWLVISLVVLAGALSRKDIDPVTRLTWVLVIILVPVFGVVLYGGIAVAPNMRAPKGASLKDYQDENYSNQPTVCITCKTTIPAGATACPKCGWSYLSGSQA
jgi:hypothetical protein